ncbi:MAG: hypothetical protein R3C09_06540 [Pirellulaceae bacterium]
MPIVFPERKPNSTAASAASVARTSNIPPLGTNKSTIASAIAAIYSSRAK